MPYHIYTI